MPGRLCNKPGCSSGPGAQPMSDFLPLSFCWMILLLLHCSSTAPGGQQTQNMQTAGPNTPSSKIQSLLLTWVLWCIFLFTPPTLPGDPLCARCCTQPCHSCWYTEKGNEEELDNSHLNKWSRAIPGVSAAEYRAARAYEGSGETHTLKSMLFPFLSFTTLAQSQSAMLEYTHGVWINSTGKWRFLLGRKENDGKIWERRLTTELTHSNAQVSPSLPVHANLQQEVVKRAISSISMLKYCYSWYAKMIFDLLNRHWHECYKDAKISKINQW